MIKWIPIKENGLPDKKGSYLVHNSHENTFYVADIDLFNHTPYWYYSISSRKEIQDLMMIISIDKTITHWAEINTENIEGEKGV